MKRIASGEVVLALAGLCPASARAGADDPTLKCFTVITTVYAVEYKKTADGPWLEHAEAPTPELAEASAARFALSSTDWVQIRVRAEQRVAEKCIGIKPGKKFPPIRRVGQ
jgi:hypothetical protein